MVNLADIPRENFCDGVLIIYHKHYCYESFLLENTIASITANTSSG